MRKGPRICKDCNIILVQYYIEINKPSNEKNTCNVPLYGCYKILITPIIFFVNFVLGLPSNNLLTTL
jgi:hypothetical protein